MPSILLEMPTRPPDNATAEQWQIWWDDMLTQMQTTIAILERVDMDAHNIPLDS